SGRKSGSGTDFALNSVPDPDFRRKSTSAAMLPAAAAVDVRLRVARMADAVRTLARAHLRRGHAVRDRRVLHDRPAVPLEALLLRDGLGARRDDRCALGNWRARAAITLDEARRPRRGPRR